MSQQESNSTVSWVKDARGYNDRLFQSGLRGWFHSGRFRWLAAHCSQRFSQPPSVLEIGCFDGKVLRYIQPAPRRYLGLDANWEGGLDLAKSIWADLAWAEFQQCTSPSEVPSNERFQASICMETLEHLPDDVLEGYISRLGDLTEEFAFITAPNEIGPVCLFKQLSKKLFFGGSSFRWIDIWHATTGQARKIPRDEHRGFDYRNLVRQLGNHFRVVSVEGIPFRFLPAYLNFTVGIVLVPKSPADSSAANLSA